MQVNANFHIPIDGASRIYGIIGHPVSHSLSPAIHNLAFRHHKLNAVYLPFDLQETGLFLKRAIPALGICGLSVTIPHKSWAATIADRSDRLTALCRAANTLVFTRRGITAYNTDGEGALQALRERAGELKGKRYLVLGYGGSAAAIVTALLLSQRPATVTVTGRNEEKSRQFTTRIRRRLAKGKALPGKSLAGSNLKSSNFSRLQPQDVEIIINTTPLGMQQKRQALPLPADFVQNFHTVFDIVYRPAKTALLQLAQARGAIVVPGYLMFLYQAVLQFEIFSGKKAPLALMKRQIIQQLDAPI